MKQAESGMLLLDEAGQFYCVLSKMCRICFLKREGLKIRNLESDIEYLFATNQQLLNRFIDTIVYV